MMQNIVFVYACDFEQQPVSLPEKNHDIYAGQSHFMSAFMYCLAVCSAAMCSGGLPAQMLAHGFQLSLINTADALGPLADIIQTSTVFPNGS